MFETRAFYLIVISFNTHPIVLRFHKYVYYGCYTLLETFEKFLKSVTEHGVLRNVVALNFVVASISSFSERKEEEKNRC